MHLSIYLLCALCSLLSAVSANEHEYGADADRHLHDSQIPPPGKQPSREDITSMLSEVFTLIDKNADKQLNGDELKKWLEKVHHSLVNENVLQQWNYYHPEMTEVHSWENYEPETTETIGWEQYVNMTYPEDVVKEINGSEEPKSEDDNFKNYLVMYKRAVKRWKAADKNGDNILVKDEFKNFIHPEESESSKHILVDEAMEDMDTDSNGEVTLEEYVKHMSDVSQEEDRQDPNFWQNQQSQFATYLDKDKDGVLNKQELNEWLIPDYDRHEAEAMRMIHDGDNNSDQLLSNEEVVSNEDYFLSLIPAEFWRRFSDDDTTTTATPHDEF